MKKKMHDERNKNKKKQQQPTLLNKARIYEMKK